MEDLINLSGPLTEDAVMKTLQSRFNDKNYFVSINLRRFIINFIIFFLQSR